MGMYTELVFAAELKKDTPSSVIDLLRFMAGNLDKEGEWQDYSGPFPDHTLFTKPGSRWRMLFRCDSYYFHGDTHSSFRYDDIAKAWFLTVRSNLKNYNDEIEKFVDWITLYLDESLGQFLGYKRYETDRLPTLLFHPNKWVLPTVPKEEKCPIARTALIDTASMEFSVPSILDRLEKLQEAVKEAIAQIEELEPTRPGGLP